MDLMKNLLETTAKSESDDAVEKPTMSRNFTRFHALLDVIKTSHDKIYGAAHEDGSEFRRVVKEITGNKMDEHFKDIRMHVDAIIEALGDIEIAVDSAYDKFRAGPKSD